MLKIIKTAKIEANFCYVLLSPLTQGRELKFALQFIYAILNLSPLTQGRELKFDQRK